MENQLISFKLNVPYGKGEDNHPKRLASGRWLTNFPINGELVMEVPHKEGVVHPISTNLQPDWLNGRAVSKRMDNCLRSLVTQRAEINNIDTL